MSVLPDRWDVDWTPDHARAALAALGRSGLGPSTRAVVQCPRHHELCRLVQAREGVVVMASLPAYWTHSAARQDRVKIPAQTVISLLTPHYLRLLDEANMLDVREVATRCSCGPYSLSPREVVDLARERPEAREAAGIPRVLLPDAQAARDGG